MNTTTAFDQASDDPTRNPLAPITLARAGVPSQDAQWITRLTVREQMQALIHSKRGQAILAKLRALSGVPSSPEPVTQ